MARKLTKYDQALIERRNTLWPGSEAEVYDRKEESGFSTLPRTLSLVATLIRHLSNASDPTKVYFALWLRQRDNGLVEITNPEDLAAECGYTGTRKVRSLHEALDALETLGFIRTAPRGTRKYAFALVLHPHDVVQRIKQKEPKLIPDWWWSLFELRVQEIKAELRIKPKKKAAESFEDFPESLDGDGDDLPF